MRGAVVPTSMGVAAALQGVGAGSGRGSVHVEVLGLMESTHLAWLSPNSKGLASPTNMENRGGSDSNADGMAGGGTDSRTNGDEN